MRVICRIFYFSADNLAKDVFLRQNMDGDGFVPLSLLASFPRIRRLGLNEPAIFDAVSTCNLFILKGAAMVCFRYSWPLSKAY